MSSVQSIRRAFAVLGALGDGPLGVTDVADRAGLPKSTAARLLATLAEEGAVEQVPGDSAYRLGPRLVAPGRRASSLTRTLAAIAQPDPRRAGGGVRRGGRAGRAGRRPRPLRRSGRHAQPGRRPRLDRLARAAPRRLVRAGPAGVPVGARRGPLPGPAAGGAHAAAPSSTRTPCASGCARSGGQGYAWAIEEFDPGISSVAAPDRRCVRRGRRRGPPPRPVVSIPGPGRGRRAVAARGHGRRAHRRGVARGLAAARRRGDPPTPSPAFAGGGEAWRPTAGDRLEVDRAHAAGLAVVGADDRPGGCRRSRASRWSRSRRRGGRCPATRTRPPGFRPLRPLTAWTLMVATVERTTGSPGVPAGAGRLAVLGGG